MEPESNVGSGFMPYGGLGSADGQVMPETDSEQLSSVAGLEDAQYVINIHEDTDDPTQHVIPENDRDWGEGDGVIEEPEGNDTERESSDGDSTAILRRQNIMQLQANSKGETVVFGGLGARSGSREAAMDAALLDVDEDGQGGMTSHRGHRLDHIFDVLDQDGVLNLQNKKLCQRRFCGHEDRGYHDLDEVLLTGERRRRKLQTVAKLNLSQNRLTQYTADLAIIMPHLQVLDLRANRLEEISPMIKDLK